MKKKVLAMVLTAVCAMGLMAGCGNSGNAAGDTSAKESKKQSDVKIGVLVQDVSGEEALGFRAYYEDYIDENGQSRSRQNGYKAVQNLSISSKELNKITSMLSLIQNYRINHESVTFDNPQYLLSDLEKIKHDLIGKATEDANKRAAEFAKTGNAEVGVMRSASQGSFNILDANNPESDDSEYGGTYDKDGVDKLVRLVVTIDYTID